MTMSTMKSQFNLQKGAIINGKWHHKQYRIEKELGAGANGVVYLATYLEQLVALKISENGYTVTSEVNVLKSFTKVQGSTLGPSLLDVDDWQFSSSTMYSFYVMEYIHGPDLHSFIKQKGEAWIPVLMLQLLSDLEELHKAGWVFGDLKPENLIVTGRAPRIRCIDVGGTTLKGRAIKEFTEFYDRGYWGLGSRKAEPTYDLFSTAMVFIHCAYPSRFSKDGRGLEQLMDRVKKHKILKTYEGVLIPALQGRFKTAEDMRQALLACSYKQTRPKGTGVSPPARQASRKTKGKPNGKTGAIVLILFIGCIYFFYLYSQMV